MKNRSPHKDTILSAGPKLAITSFTFLLTSLLAFYMGVPLLIKTFITKETRLVEGTETWQKWTDVTVPILIKFYIFNVTNVAEAEMGGKFKLQEVGPYVWEEKRSKQILAIDEDEDTVTYKEVVRYYFRRDLSVGSDEDRLNIVNLPFISAATLIYKLLYTSLANYVIDFFIQMDEKFVLRDAKIKELVFDGVELGDTYKILGDFGVVDLPAEFIDGTFAFYNQRNGTPSPDFKVKRGVKNYEDFGKIVEFDHKTELDWWTDPALPENAEQYCNKINGTDGSIFAPFQTKDKVLKLFIYEVCRSLHLRFNRELNFKGIPAYEYRAASELLQTIEQNPANHCFCTDPGQGLKNFCDVKGALRIFRCKSGMPVVLALPHYFQASQRYRDEVDGMEPDADKHEISLVLEPNTGAVLQVIKRIQFGVEFQRLPDIVAFSNITEATVPIVWAEERGDVDDKYTSDLRTRLVSPMEILKILKPAAIGLFSFLFFLGIVLTVYKKKEEENKLIPYGIDYQ